jgi:aldehyde:ferredoxin oxidoreductase
LSQVGGYNGKLAIVDLTLGTVEFESLPTEELEKFIGGRGIGAKFLWDIRKRGKEDPRDFIGIFVGPLTATGIPLANRVTIVFHSPLTNTVAYCNTGGYAGTALKLSGLDGIIVRGNSDAPKYLLVKKGSVSVQDAQAIWTKQATDCMGFLKSKHGDVRVLSIGPAGENLVKFANIVNDAGRASGVRHGVGYAFGIKKLKAVAILADYSERLPIANKPAFREVLTRLSAKIKNSPLLNRETGLFSLYGTPLAVDPLNSNEAIPIRNYSLTFNEHAGNLSGKRMSETILVSRLTCNSCAVQCRRETTGLVKYGFRVEGPDYAQISSLGSNCEVFDLESVAYMNYLCYEIGLDPIELGNILAIYADASQKGIVESRHGNLKWGDADSMIGLIGSIARKESGLGELLARGASDVVNELGDDTLDTSIKGITIQNADPRVETAWGLLNATENSGGSLHIWVYPDLIYSFREIPGIKSLLSSSSDDQPDKIAARVKWKQDLVAIFDSLQICAFSSMAFDPIDYVDALNAITGWQWNEEDLLLKGERIFDLERAYDNAFGIREDSMPSKFVTEEIPNGRNEGRKLELDPLLREYYTTRGWDNGAVGENKLSQLGI